MIDSEIKAALGLVSTLMRIQGGENVDFDADQKTKIKDARRLLLTPIAIDPWWRPTA